MTDGSWTDTSLKTGASAWSLATPSFSMENAKFGTRSTSVKNKAKNLRDNFFFILSYPSFLYETKYLRMGCMRIHFLG